MNIYRYKFTCKCPNDDNEIEYRLEIKSAGMIMAEDIVKHCKQADGYQEHIAGYLKSKIGASIQLTGIHSGVEIISVL